MRLGVGAGDHAAIIWPLLCGMAKAKYYLLTADFLDGKEADASVGESLCAIGRGVTQGYGGSHRARYGLTAGDPVGKRALNNWLRQAGPIFDHSLALEMLGFFTDDVAEGLQALRDKRPPAFPSPRTIHIGA